MPSIQPQNVEQFLEQQGIAILTSRMAEGARRETATVPQQRNSTDAAPSAPEAVRHAAQTGTGEPTLPPDDAAAVAVDGATEPQRGNTRDAAPSAPEVVRHAAQAGTGEPTLPTDDVAAVAVDGVTEPQQGNSTDAAPSAPVAVPHAAQTGMGEPTLPPDDAAAVAVDGVTEPQQGNSTDAAPSAPEAVPHAAQTGTGEPTLPPDDAAAVAGDGAGSGVTLTADLATSSIAGADPVAGVPPSFAARDPLAPAEVEPELRRRVQTHRSQQQPRQLPGMISLAVAGLQCTDEENAMWSRCLTYAFESIHSYNSSSSLISTLTRSLNPSPTQPGPDVAQQMLRRLKAKLFYDTAIQT